MDKKKAYYWTDASGRKIDVDLMDLGHLRNTLKMLIRMAYAKKIKEILDKKVVETPIRIEL
jgi:hypothetical protein